jgi:DNA polymerase-3 subunit alpha
MTPFVSLHNQTDFSILDSIISVKDLFQRAKELEQTAVAITEHGSFASVHDALKVSRDTGVKFIVGCECYFQDVPESKLRHVILIAKNAIGYRNLLTLNKLGFDRGLSIGKRVYPTIDWELLKKYSDGVICLTACGNGIVSQLLMNKRYDEAEQTLLKLRDIFGDNLGIEVQPNNMKRGSNIFNDEIDQQFLNRRLIDLGKKHGIKVVPACNAHYLKREDAEIHDVLLAIGAHQPVYSNYRLKYSVPDFYLKSGDEVKAFFARNYGDEFAEEICANTIYFADLCETPDWVEPKFSNPTGKELPIFPVKDEPDYSTFKIWISQQAEDLQKLDEDKLYLRFRCELFFEERIKNLNDESRQQYRDRLIEELDVLEYHGFSSYMLIVADYIDWARKNDIAVGEGRGSVGGSLVAFLLGIHQADPIKYGLIFARFHNKDKSAMPDVDSDFAPSGRERVQNYLRQKYGEDHVAHVSNVNTITPKVYVRDIARACELGGSREEAVKIGTEAADCIPKEITSIDDAFNKLPLFAEYCKKYPEFLKYKSICGKYRAWSTHAAGIVISARPLTGMVSLRKDKDGALAIEYDKNKAEDMGLVKMDTLGVSTLDIIGETYEIIKRQGKELPPTLLDYDAYDKATYDLIAKGDTFCVFQFGTSAGTIDLCRRIKPTTINDLANINALARPSARGMRGDFIATRDGKKEVSLLHPKLGRAFNGTYGFGLYEECLMYLAQDIAGWSLHSADRLRKLTKEKGKNPKKVQQWRTEFINDATKTGVNEIIAKRIWDEVIELFQGYGFNQSHAVLYSMVGYRTAYLKAHYPIEFLLANLMSEVNSNAPDAKSNIDKIKKELRSHKIKILPPDINTSQLTYVIEDKNLLTGLDALKFVGDDAIKDIIEKRPFKSFLDFMSRVSSKSVRANSIQALASAGAMDSFGIPRKLIYLYCSDYRKKLQVWMKKHDPLKEEFVYPWPEEKEWSVSELYALEQFYLGEAFVCKPPKAYGQFFGDIQKTVMDVRKSKDRSNINSIKGIIKNFFEFRVKKETSKYYGQSMIKAIIEDGYGDQCSCTIFPDRWKTIQGRIKEINSKLKFDVGAAMHFSGNTNSYEDEMGIIVDQLFNIIPPPTVPADLKPQKINLKLIKNKAASDIGVEADQVKNMIESLEDDLYDQGLLDLDEEED